MSSNGMPKVPNERANKNKTFNAGCLHEGSRRHRALLTVAVLAELFFWCFLVPARTQRAVGVEPACAEAKEGNTTAVFGCGILLMEGDGW